MTFCDTFLFQFLLQQFGSLADCEIIYNERGSKVNFIFQGLPFLQMDILMTDLGNLIIELSKSDLIIASKCSDDRDRDRDRFAFEGRKDGKRERERPRRQWEIRDTQDIFDVFATEVGRLAIIDRNCLRGVAKNATSFGDKLSAVSSQIELSDLKERFSIVEI